MAIPHRTTITCPACGTSEDRIIADTSIGPHSMGAPRTGPVYAMIGGPLWEVSETPGAATISCTTCGERDFVTLADQAQIMQGRIR